MPARFLFLGKSVLFPLPTLARFLGARERRVRLELAGAHERVAEDGSGVQRRQPGVKRQETGTRGGKHIAILRD